MTCQKHLQAIETADGQRLAATVYLPGHQPALAVIIAAAMGARRGFYRPFTEFLSGNGCAVARVDYRGSGDSLSG